MIFVVVIIALFIGASIYFFFRAETLQRELIVVKRETKSIKKENQALYDSMAVLISQYESFAQTRYKVLKDQQVASEDETNELSIIAPLINNYAVIANECLKNKGQLAKIARKCYLSVEPDAYKEFSRYINKQEDRIQRMWSSNQLKGFLSLVEALLTDLEKK